jgi:hypothetical protein
METAINIGYVISFGSFNTYRILRNIHELNIYDTFHRYACSLLRQGMKQITITLETADIIALEKGSDKAATAKVRKL